MVLLPALLLVLGTASLLAVLGLAHPIKPSSTSSPGWKLGGTGGQMSPFILNGSYVGTLNWIVSLQHPHYSPNHQDLKHFCAGSLITNQLILTAAHCLYLPGSEIRLDLARLGVKKSRNRLHDDTQPARIDYIILHPLYNNTRPSTFLQHDIALLRMEHPIVLNDNQGTVDLPDPAVMPILDSNTDVTAAGWGYRQRDPSGQRNESLPNQLQQAGVRILDLETCMRRWPALTVTNDMFCLDSTKTDICQGDSGDPIFEEYWNREEQLWKTRLRGVISASSKGCGQNDGASIITNVAQYVNDFIRPIIADLKRIKASP